MKTFAALLGATCFTCATAFAQSTMPAMGANNQKGQVSKTDASLNPRAEGSDSTHMHSKKTSHKSGRKMKMKNTSSNSM